MSTAAAARPPFTPEDVPLQPRDWLQLAVPGLVWGSSFFLIAEGLDSFSPYLVTWLRITFGMIVIAAVPSSRQPVAKSVLPRVAVIGLIWMALPLSLFPLAEQRVSSSVVGMLNGATPIFAAIVATAIRRALPPGRQLLGLTVGLVGIVLIAAPSWSKGSSSASGVLLVLAALVCYGLALNVLAPLQREFGALPLIGRALVVAFVLTAPFGLAAIDDSDFAWRSALAVGVLGAFGTGLAYVFMGMNAGQFGSTRAASTTYLIPGFSLFLGLVFRDESVAALAIVGCVVAVGGAYLVNTGVRSAT